MINNWLYTTSFIFFITSTCFVNCGPETDDQHGGRLLGTRTRCGLSNGVENRGGLWIARGGKVASSLAIFDVFIRFWKLLMLSQYIINDSIERLLVLSIAGRKQMTTTALECLSTLHVAGYRTVWRTGGVVKSSAEEKWPQVWHFLLIDWWLRKISKVNSMLNYSLNTKSTFSGFCGPIRDC